MAPQTEKLPENKMGTMRIGPLLANVSLPIVLSMLVQALYNVVDSVFVAQLPQSEAALAAVGLVFPIQNLMIAVAVGTGVGINSLLSRRLGEGNRAAANKVANNGVLLGLLGWVLFLAVGLLFTDAFFAGYRNHPGMGAEIAEMGAAYMRIVTVGSLGVFMAITYERLLQATGRTVYTMISQMAGAVTNIILDPIMIFGLLGFPALGVAGAAWATVIGQFVGMFLCMLFNHLRNPEIHLQLKGFRPEWRTIKGIYGVGLPSILMQSIGSVMVGCMNFILAAFGATPVSVFGVYFKLQSFVILPVLGFNNGMVSIVAYNFGARKPKRIAEAIRLGLIVCFCIMLAGTVLFWLLPAQLLSLFQAGPSMTLIGSAALRIISIGFPMAAFTIIFSGVFQAVGKGVNSLILSFVRQIVFLLPIAWLLSRTGDLEAIWAAFPIAELAAMLLAIVLFRRLWAAMIRPLSHD